MPIQPRSMAAAMGAGVKDGEPFNRTVRLHLQDGDTRSIERLMADLYPAEPKPPLAPPEFNIGDVVQLKSGGIGMVVLGDACCGHVRLIYSVGGGLEELNLPRAALQNFDPLAADGPDFPF